MNYVRSNSLSLKYLGFPPSDSQDIGIRKFEFVAKRQFLWQLNFASFKNLVLLLSQTRMSEG